MKRLVLGITLLILAMAVVGCGAPPVDEATLPTRVPTLAADAFVVAIPPIAQGTPVPQPTAEAATEEVEEAVVDEDAVEEEVAPTPGAAEEATEELTEEPTEVPAEEAVEETAAEPTEEDVAGGEEAAQPEATEEAGNAAAATPDAADAASAEDAAAEGEEESTAADSILPTPTPAATTPPAPADEPEAEPTAEADAPRAPADAAEGDEEAADEAQGDPVLDGLPPTILAAMATSDAARGQQLSLTHACIGCHALAPNQIMAGPTWYDLANTAATRVEGESAGLYLYNSIIHPNDFVVPGYQPNIMLQIYENTLSDQDLADIIAYMLSLDATP